MPYPSSLQPFVDATTITADSINVRVQAVEHFINGDIEQSDLPTNGFVDSTSMVGPEFYGAPAPRVHLMSSDVHYRRGRGGDDTQIFYHKQDRGAFLPIPGLAATFHVDIPDGWPNTTVQVHIRASFHARNINSISDGTDLDAVVKYLTSHCASFQLYVDGNQIPGTLRYLYPETTAQALSASQNINMVGIANLSRGLHNVYVGIKSRDSANGSNKGWYHNYIRHRTLNIEIHYL
jgi:hypothetical protein